MLKIFFIFGLLGFLKSTLISYFYDNYLMFLLFPLEVSGLSLLNTNLTVTDSKYLDYNNYLQWIIINWIGSENDYKILNEIESESYNNYIIILSWVLSYILYQVYYLVKQRLKNEKIDKISWANHNLKYLFINYFSLFLWNLISLLNLNKTLFWISLVNLILFNFITFWFPGLIFNFLYGEHLFYFRTNYSFILDNYHPKFKYFTIILLGFKFLTGFYILLHKYFKIESKFILYLILFFYNFILRKNKIFLQNYYFNIFILSLVSFIFISISIFENYFKNYKIIFVIKIFILFLYLILFYYFLEKHFKKNYKKIEVDIQMNNII